MKIKPITMKKKLETLLIALTVITTTNYAQTTLKEYKAGHEFYISLPDYMSKTTGLNSAATIQFKNTVKDIAGFIIEDNKEELAMAQMSYSSLNEFYEEFIKDFLKDEDKRKVSKPQTHKKGESNFIECDVTYYDKESKLDIYYFVGIAETKTAYYKILCYGTIESKDKFKKDFESILLSLRD